MKVNVLGECEIKMIYLFIYLFILFLFTDTIIMYNTAQ